jgi:hypothetical protein
MRTSGLTNCLVLARAAVETAIRDGNNVEALTAAAGSAKSARWIPKPPAEAAA